MRAEADGWITHMDCPPALSTHQHTPPHFVADGRHILRVSRRISFIAATVSPDLDDPLEAARIVADALNAQLR